MDIFNRQNKFTKTTITIGFILVLYGYLCRIIGFYFFWESKSIGWAILFIGIIGFLSNRVKINTKEKKKTTLEKIGIGLIIFVFLIQTIFIAIIPFTDAYLVSKNFFINDSNLKKEIGNIQGFGLIPMGGIQIASDSSGEYGSATIILTVKGEKKFKDFTVNVVKYIDSPEWKVEAIE